MGKDETPNKASDGCCTRPEVNAKPAVVGPDVGAKVVVVVTGDGEISAGRTTKASTAAAVAARVGAAV